MKLQILILFLICGCSSFEWKESSDFETIKYGNVSSKKSLIKVFSSGKYIYLELKDKMGKLIDCKSSEISVQNKDGDLVHFSFHRSSRGKYYISPEKEILNGMIISVGGTTLKTKSNIHKFTHNDFTPKLTLRMSMPYKAIFRLKTEVPLPELPEIITEGGNGVIEELKKVDGTTWEFALIYPEQDQLIYISARSQGILLIGGHRFQHVELK